MAYPNMFKKKRNKEFELNEMMLFLKDHDKELYDLALNMTLGVFDNLCIAVDKIKNR